MPGKLTILGSGTSYGIPVIGCDCPVCHSKDPRDHRTRAAAWISGSNGTSVLIDAGADLRVQCLREGIRSLDAVLLTHIHADHLNGIDDLRAFSLRSRQELPFYASANHLQFIQTHFEYMFQDKTKELGWGIPRLLLKAVGTEPFCIGEFTIQPVPLKHGTSYSTGYRINDLAYLTDCSEIPLESWQYLHGVKILVIDALRWRPHATHNSILESIAVAERIHPELTVFTHMSHEICHEADSKTLPPKTMFAYDGLVLPF